MAEYSEIVTPVAVDGVHDWRSVQLDAGGVVHARDLSPQLRARAAREVRAGRWRRARRDVFVTHNGPLSADQRAVVALRCAPAGAALSGSTAAELEGLKGFDEDVVYVTVPCGTSGIRLDGVIVHYSRFLDEADVNPLRAPARTRMPRSLLDAASWAGTDNGARAVLLAGVQQRLTTPLLLRGALPRRGPCLRHELILETIADAEGGIASVPERGFELIRRAQHLPLPTRQHPVQRSDGRWYLDVFWEAQQLAAEVDGTQHLQILNWDADLDRMNSITVAGLSMLRFSSYAVRRRPEAVGATLRQAFIARGWGG